MTGLRALRSPYVSNEDAAGARGQSLSLTNGAYVEILNSTSVNQTGPITLEAWINPAVPLRQQGIVERYASDANGVSNGGYALRLTDQGKLLFGTTSTGHDGAFVVGGTTVSVKVWHHVVGVFDGNAMRVYLDGVEDGAVSSTFSPGNGSATLKIGARGDDASFPFNGLIDEVRISSGAIYTGGFVPQMRLAPMATTVGLWTFDDGTAKDVSANANDGSGRGSIIFTPSAPGYHEFIVEESLWLENGAYVEIPNSTSVNQTGPITLEAWINPAVQFRQQGIVERYSSDVNGLSNGGYALRLTDGGKLLFGATSTGHDGAFVVGSTMLPANMWHHVAGVFDGNAMRVYLDGVEDGAIATEFAPGNGSATLKIGARGDDASFPFGGLIDEVRISSGAIYTGGFVPQARLGPMATTIGLWKFNNGTLKDDSAKRNDGTARGALRFSPEVPGLVEEKSLWLDNGAYIEIPNSASVNQTGPLTLEAWIKPTVLFMQQGIVERYASDLNGVSNGGYALRLTDQGKLLFGTTSTGHDGAFVVGGTTVQLNMWHHVAGVFDGNEMRVYLDGVEDGAVASTFAPGNGSAALKIGARGDDASSPFSGLIDEVRISSGAIYACAFVPSPRVIPMANSVGVWRFNDASPRDVSENHNDGSARGSVRFAPDVPNGN